MRPTPSPPILKARGGGCPSCLLRRDKGGGRRMRRTDLDLEAMAEMLARRMGLPEDEVDEVRQVALLHDVGKIGLGEALLDKPGPLDEAERELVRMLPAVGERIVASTEELARLAPAVRAEHERWDGLGYPDGLSGEDIPVASRIVFVCAAFHAITSERPYREALDADAALREIERNAGTQFCPRAVEALLGR
jgi:HD-GYP domain-containing protein (c-di-GMP phosphodiesterase class II)